MTKFNTTAPSTAALALALLSGGPSLAQQQPVASAPGGPARLQLVASFEHQVTGVTVAADGRIFVNFPRWSEDAPVSVAEVTGDGQVKPYPNEEWNAWRNARKNQTSPNDHFVCVQSVVADGRGSLWVVDAAAPATAQVVPGGPKLVRIDLRTNKVAQIIPFGEAVASVASLGFRLWAVSHASGIPSPSESLMCSPGRSSPIPPASASSLMILPEAMQPKNQPKLPRVSRRPQPKMLTRRSGGKFLILKAPPR